MKYRFVKLTAFLLSIACGISVITVMSLPKKAVAESLQESLDNTNKLIDELRSKQSSISSEISTLNSDIDESSNRINSLTNDINNKQQQISDIDKQIEELEKEKATMYEAMKLRIQYSYENKATSIYGTLFSSDNFDDFLNKTAYVQSIVNYDKEQLTKLDHIIKEVADKQDIINRELVALGALKDEATAEADKLQSMVADKTSELNLSEDSMSKLIAQAEEYEQKLEEEKQARAEAERQAYLASIEAEKQSTSEDNNTQNNSNSSSGESNSSNNSNNSSSSSQTTTDTNTTPTNYSASELDMMAAIIYVEAGIEPYEGKVAVGSVVMNRVESSYFPNTIAGVIYQRGQFTPVASGRFELAMTNKLANEDCIRAAQEVLNGRRNVPYHFFHMYTGRTNNYSSYTIIGNHILYDF